MAKTTKTYSINDKTYELFDRICKKNSINKSSFIETKIKDYLTDNLGFDNDFLYQSRMDEECVVSILGSDDTFFELSDGSRMSKIMFYHNFKGFESVDPQEFFKSTPSSPIVEAVKNMSEGSASDAQSRKVVVTTVKVDVFNRGPEGIKKYAGSLKSDKEKSSIAKDLDKYRSKIKKTIIKKDTEEVLYGIKQLSRELKEDFSKFKSGLLSRSSVLALSKDIKLLIDIDGKQLMDEEILHRLESITSQWEITEDN